MDLATKERELWKELKPPDPAGVMGVATCELTPDGGSYAYGYDRKLSDLYLVSDLR